MFDKLQHTQTHTENVVITKVFNILILKRMIEILS